MRPRHADGALARTRDGGRTWETVAAWPTNDPHYWSTLVIDRHSPIRPGQGHQRLYLCGQNRLLRSDDAGATWRDLSGGLPRGLVKDLVTAPLGEGRTAVLAVCILPGDGSTVYRSDDDGASWQRKGDGLEATARITYLYGMNIASSPADPGTVYIAAGNCRVFRTRNLGDSWETVCQIEDGWVRPAFSADGFRGADVSFLFPNKQGEDYVNRHGYVYPKRQGGNCRHSQYSMGLTVHPSLAVSPSDSNVIAFIQGTMIATTNGGETWADICSDLGAPYAADRFPDPELAPSDHTHLMRSRGV